MCVDTCAPSSSGKPGLADIKFFFTASLFDLTAVNAVFFQKLNVYAVCVCLQVVVNGLGGAGGDQDTENTELMAIYTRENQSADKVEDRYRYWPRLS